MTTTTMMMMCDGVAGKMMMKAFPDGRKNHDVEASVSFWRTRMPQQTPSRAGMRAADKIPKKEKTCVLLLLLCLYAKSMRKRRVYFMGIDYAPHFIFFLARGLLLCLSKTCRYATRLRNTSHDAGGKWGVLLKTTRRLSLSLSLSLPFSLSLFFQYSTNHAPLPASRPYFLVPLKRLFTLPARLFPGAQTFPPDALAFARMRGDERALEDV